MKINDGNWLIRQGLQLMHPLCVHRVTLKEGEITLLAAPKDVSSRAYQLDTALFTFTFFSPREGIIGVRMENHQGACDHGPHFALNGDATHRVTTQEHAGFVTLTSGALSVKIATQGKWQIDFLRGSERITGSGARSGGYASEEASGKAWLFERLDLGVGENVYGLGERFTAFVRNGQSVDIWNRDGGTSSEQSYKNIPFYLSNRGYGVFVNHPERVEFEVASESVTKVQFCVEKGQLDRLEYFVIDGPAPKDVLGRYTALTGKAPLPPAWSFGLWLTTSFTTDYDEATVTSFIDGMHERKIPLSVFHFDCFWMKAFQWCDFQWDSDAFPDPEGLLARLKARGLKISVWINPYIGQASPLFREGQQKGYFLRRANGDVWQWDRWQPGQAIVDFTNPAACSWYADHLRRLLDMGVDCFKTDFGERIPTDVVYHDGSDAERMHNYYTQLYNQLVFQVIQEKRGAQEAVVFARSATVGGQQYPVHWGGDCNSTYESMAESLRGGLSLGLSGFAFWSHDIGGFENTTPADVYKRWCAFGLLSSHSRLHGSRSYRVPWLFDEEAVDVLRFFTQWKCRLMPYLYDVAAQACVSGTPMMRALLLDFIEDPATHTLDRQYLLGHSLLVAPVFSASGQVNYYLPAGRWTHLLTGKEQQGGGWRQETHDFMSLPLYVRPNTLLALGASHERPDYDFAADCELHLFALDDQQKASATIRDLTGAIQLKASVQRNGNTLSFTQQGAPGKRRLVLRGLSGARVLNNALTLVQTPLGSQIEIPPMCMTFSVCSDDAK